MAVGKIWWLGRWARLRRASIGNADGVPSGRYSVGTEASCLRFGRARENADTWIEQRGHNVEVDQLPQDRVKG